MPKPSKVKGWLSEDRLNLLRHWKRNGLRDDEIAEKIGIRPRTLWDWKQAYPQISTALKNGFEDLVIDAEEALFSKFQIQTLTEEKEEVWQGPDGTIKKHKIVTKKQIPPDTTAIIFFLKSKANWKDGNEIRAVIDGISLDRRKEIEALFDAGSKEKAIKKPETETDADEE